MIIEQIDKNTFDLNLLRDKESEFYFVEIMPNGRLQLSSLDAMAVYGIASRLKDDVVGLIKITR